MKVRSIAKKWMIRFYSISKIQKKVLFDSFGGRQYSADPRAISEKMHELFPDFEIVWMINSNAREKNICIIPDYVRIVEGKMGYIKELATSAAYVTTEPLTESFYKRKGQYVVQTWHGDRGIKKALYEAAESEGRRRNKIYDDKYTNICVAASDVGAECYRKEFKYTGEILKEGMPRNDKLKNLEKEEYQKLRLYFNIPDGYKVLTYAPTFRGHSVAEQTAQIDIEKTLSILEERGDKWVCLLRAHEYSSKINLVGDNARVIDVSDYPDMADILIITDMLITDYSSCAGDFILRNKPIVLVINDKEYYEKNSRALRVDLEKTGFLLSHSQEELNHMLMVTDDAEFAESCKKVMEFYGTHETGFASEEVCKRIYRNYIDYVKSKKKNMLSNKCWKLPLSSFK